MFLLSVVATAQAEEGQLGVTLDLQYRSKWLSKGKYGYGTQGAIFKITDLNFYDSGFGVKVTHRNATASGYVDKQRFDYRPYYKSVLFEDESYATKSGYSPFPGRTLYNRESFLNTLPITNMLPVAITQKAPVGVTCRQAGFIASFLAMTLK